MVHKTTVTLSDDLHAAWKAAGLPLAEVIRRSLAGTGDAARHAATEARLAGIEQRLAQLEATRSVFSGNGHQADDTEAGVTAADPPTLEQIEQRRDLHDRARASMWHRQLVRHLQPDKTGQRIATATTAGAAFRTGAGAARDRLHTLVSFRFAQLLDDGETPYRWLIHPLDEQDTNAAPVA